MVLMQLVRPRSSGGGLAALHMLEIAISASPAHIPAANDALPRPPCLGAAAGETELAQYLLHELENRFEI